MAYKFQLGAFVASGSLVQEGAFEADAAIVDSLDVNSGGITEAGAIAGATSIDGSGDLTMGTITMSGFSVDADGDTAIKSLAIDNSSTIGCDADADIITLAAQSMVLGGDVDFNVAKAGGLQIAGVAVTATAAELNYLDNDSLTAADITKLAALDASAAELDHLDGIGDAAYDAAADSVVFFDATDSKLKYEAANDFTSTLAGDGIKSASGVLALDLNELTAANWDVANDKLAFIDATDNSTKKKVLATLLVKLLVTDLEVQAVSWLFRDLAPLYSLVINLVFLALSLVMVLDTLVVLIAFLFWLLMLMIPESKSILTLFV